MQNIFFDDTAIEIHREVETGNIRHVVFDFDGTISLIRDGWQNVMVPDDGRMPSNRNGYHRDTRAT